jgi:transposase
MIHYRVHLLPTGVAELSAIISKGLHSTRTLRNAYILLNCDEGTHASKVSDEQLARVLCISERTIERVKKRFCEEGWAALLSESQPAASMSARWMVKWKPTWYNCAAVNRPRAAQGGLLDYWQTR